MAIGNIIQGMAHGAVGDIILSRLNGQQISRVRNRNPQNPRTNKQLYQRAIMATVMRAYAAGAEIFDHSFETYKAGAESQHRFFKRNCDNLRAKLYDDLTNKSTAGVMRTVFGAPSVNFPVPSPYIISEGTLQTGIFQCTANGSTEYGTFNCYGVDLPDVTGGANTYAEIAELFIDEGYISTDDIYTLCWFAVDTTDLPEFEITDYSAGCSKQYPGGFGYVRIEFNENVLSNTNSCPSNYILIGDGTSGSSGGFFKITADTGYYSTTAVTNLTGLTLASGRRLNLLLQPSGSTSAVFAGYMGVIRSRKNSNLRSNTTMIYSGLANNVAINFGLNSYYVLLGWQQATQSLGDSSLVLEGG